VVFPNSYHVGMSNLAVHILYGMLNARDDVVCERFFYEEGMPLVSVESSRPLSSFASVFFTLSFELDYPNIVTLLEQSSVPVVARDRGEGSPLVIAGGVCVMANPEPVAPFFDLMVLGDIEATLPQFMERFVALQASGRMDIIAGLDDFPFVYRPDGLSVKYREDGRIADFEPPDLSVSVEHYSGDDLGTSVIISPGTEFGDMALIEGTRGCPSRCSFCLIGNLYRFRTEDIRAAIGDTRDVGIVGGGMSFHPRIIEIVENFREQGIRVHLPSLRLDEVPIELIGLLKDDIKTLTFGIEAATGQLRARLGKNITDEEILTRIDAIMELKSFNLKLYFIIGTPGETLDDIDAIPEIVKRVRHIMIQHGSPRGSLGNITIHVSPLVPKAATPFQWIAMEDMDGLKEKTARLRAAFRKIDNTVFTHDSIKFSFLQAVFSRGDRRISDVIIRLAHGTSFNKIVRESSINLNFYALRERAPDEIFPWDFIRGHVSKEKLHETFKRRFKV
jgi:radical SAM superfamily enzyme YgiQ (UPF0313 family)